MTLASFAFWIKDPWPPPLAAASPSAVHVVSREGKEVAAAAAATSIAGALPKSSKRMRGRSLK